VWEHQFVIQLHRPKKVCYSLLYVPSVLCHCWLGHGDAIGQIQSGIQSPHGSVGQIQSGIQNPGGTIGQIQSAKTVPEMTYAILCRVQDRFSQPEDARCQTLCLNELSLLHIN